MVAQLLFSNSPQYLKIKVSLSCSWDAVICPHPKPNVSSSSPLLCFLKIHFNIILPSLCRSSESSRFSTKHLFFFSPIHALCPAHPIHLISPLWWYKYVAGNRHPASLLWNTVCEPLAYLTSKYGTSDLHFTCSCLLRQMGAPSEEDDEEEHAVRVVAKRTKGQVRTRQFGSMWEANASASNHIPPARCWWNQRIVTGNAKDSNGKLHGHLQRYCVMYVRCLMCGERRKGA